MHPSDIIDTHQLFSGFKLALGSAISHGG